MIVSWCNFVYAYPHIAALMTVSFAFFGGLYVGTGYCVYRIFFDKSLLTMFTYFTLKDTPK
jgi:hypothetical protein